MDYLITANLGGYQPQLPILEKRDIDGIAIVDEFYTGGSNGWVLLETQYLKAGSGPLERIDFIRESRRAKMMPEVFFPFEEGDRHVYVDSAFIPDDPKKALDAYLIDRRDMGLFRHPRRQNPREEISALTHAERRLLNHEEACRAVCMWEDRNFSYMEVPMHIGGVLFRRHNDAVRAFNERWWDNFLHLELERDQLTLDLSLWEIINTRGLDVVSWDVNYHFDRGWGFTYVPKTRRK